MIICEPVRVYFYFHQMIFTDQRITEHSHIILKLQASFQSFLRTPPALKIKASYLSLSLSLPPTPSHPRSPVFGNSRTWVPRSSHVLIACSLQIRLATFIFVWSRFQFTSHSASADVCLEFLSTHTPREEKSLKSLKSEVVFAFMSPGAAGSLW